MADVRDTYPGKINFATERQNFSGCAVKIFVANSGSLLEGQINEWAEKNPNMLVVDTKLGVSTGEHVDLLYMTITYAKILSDEEIEELNEINSIVSQVKAERDEKRQAARAEAEKREQQYEVERQDLLKLGRVCKDNHGAVIEENRKLKDEVKKFKKASGK